MQCLACQHDNPAQARFCMTCGAGLRKTCRWCRAELPAEAAFCMACGQPGGDSLPLLRFDSPESYTPRHLVERILTMGAPRAGERKQVTVLFADMKGSLELLADRDPEEARKLLDPVLEHMMEAVHRYEGTVNQVMGDGIMALFGAPLAHEDHAVRACYAALRMQESVKRTAEEVRRAESVSIRVGLNSGEVVVRSIGSDLSMDYTAVGQTTHLAARMEQLAEPGTILLTAATARLAEGHIDLRRRGALPVRGLTEPVEAFELVGAIASRTRWQARAARGLTPFVGRRAELVTLVDALDRAEAGHGQVVGVVGEPGVGKSRLAWELAHYGATDRHTVRETGCVPYGLSTPYSPMLELLRGYFGLAAGSDVAAARDRVVERLGALDEALLPLAGALQALLEIADADSPWRALDAAERRHRTHEAVTELLIRDSRARSLILIVEDLQWADSESRALLDRLVETLSGHRILLIATYRAEYRHGWTRLPSYREIALAPLGRAPADQLLETLLGTDPALAPLRRQLVERTAGNPFFIEETVRSLVEAGVLVGAPGAFHPAQALGAIHVPATVHAVLASRIDRLPAEQKRLLQTAAVIGRDVSLRLLQAVADQREDTLQANLASLQGADFLNETELFPEREYAFKHALIHDVAYDGLLRDLRRTLHARIIAAIEASWPDRLSEHVDRLAEHAHRGEVWDAALRYCRQAGTKAAARSAHSEAVACYVRALDALEHLSEGRERVEQAVDLHLSAANSLLPIRELASIGRHLREAERQAETIDDRPRLARVSSFLATYAWLSGRHEEAVGHGSRALGIAQESGDFGVAVSTHLALGESYHALGRYREAIEVLGRNVAALHGDLEHRRMGLVGLPSVLSRVWVMWSFAELGDFVTARPISEEAVQIAERASHPYSQITAYFGAGGLHLRRGELTAAISVLEHALALCRVWDTQLPQWFLGVAPSLGHAYALAGRVDEAIPLLHDSIERATNAGMLYGQPLRLAWLADAYLRAGRLVEAQQLAPQALEMARAQGERGHEAWMLGVLAEIVAGGNSAEEAEVAYGNALALARSLGMRPRLAVGHLGLGRLHRSKGDRSRAVEHLAVAVDLLRAMEMPFWLTQAEAELEAVEAQ